MNGLERPTFRKTQSNLEFSRPPDPDFNHVNENSRFLGEGGSRTAPIGDPDFIFVSINGQLGSVRGS